MVLITRSNGNSNFNKNNGCSKSKRHIKDDKVIQSN